MADREVEIKETEHTQEDALGNKESASETTKTESVEEGDKEK